MSSTMELKTFVIEDNVFGNWFWKPNNEWMGWQIPYLTKEMLTEFKNSFFGDAICEEDIFEENGMFTIEGWTFDII